MNQAIQNIYESYLPLVGSDATAAANLALAEVLKTSSGQQISDNKPMTVAEASKLLRVSNDKVLDWIRTGRLRAFDLSGDRSPRPSYRIDPDDLKMFLQFRSTSALESKTKKKAIPDPKWEP
jgi:excisionase family DNA binding protein